MATRMPGGTLCILERESDSTDGTAIGNSWYGIANGIAGGIPVGVKCKGQGQADGKAVGGSRYDIANDS